MAKLFKTLLFLNVFFLAQTVSADQLAYIKLDQAKVAKEFLGNESHVIIWCACCDNDEKQYLTVDNVFYKNVDYKDLYQVVLQGKDKNGKLQTVNLDLAYTHVLKDDLYYTVGKTLNFECDPCTKPFGIENQTDIYSNPSFKSKSSDYIDILEVHVAPKFIVLHILYKSPFGYENGGWSRISSDTYIKNSNGGKRYSLFQADGIAIAPNTTDSDFAGQHRSFRLFFPKIPDLGNRIDMIECSEEGCFNFFEISLANKSN